MQVYISLNGTRVERLSTFSCDLTDIPVTLNQPIDLDKLPGYTIEGQEGTNYLVFDSQQYEAFVAEQNQEKEKILADQLLSELLKELALKSATDTQAITLTSHYPQWSGDSVTYTADQRLQYSGKLYRVLQAHTSQSDWTPDAAVSLFAEVK